MTMETAFCLEAVEEALAKHGSRRFSTPTKAVNSSAAFTGLLLRHGDLHGWKGTWRDNVFVERLWRSVK